MINPDVLTLVNPQNGHLAFRIQTFDNVGYFDHIQRNNYYTIVWVERGSGILKADFSEYKVEDNSMFAFSPYQPYMFSSDYFIGVAIHFHPDFFCIFAHQKEIHLNGVLFNNVYQPPFVKVTPDTEPIFSILMSQMKSEMQHKAIGQNDLLESYLKIFLITASRLKIEQQQHSQIEVDSINEPYILQNLKEAIEKDFRKKHSASDYAEALNISTKTLAKLTKTHFNKTLTDLISERIIIEAKRELYLTNKNIKEIAYALGYNDAYYFSRFFKTNTDISPQMYRNTVGFGRSEDS